MKILSQGYCGSMMFTNYTYIKIALNSTKIFFTSDFIPEASVTISILPTSFLLVSHNLHKRDHVPIQWIELIFMNRTLDAGIVRVKPIVQLLNTKSFMFLFVIWWNISFPGRQLELSNFSVSCKIPMFSSEGISKLLTRVAGFRSGVYVVWGMHTSFHLGCIYVQCLCRLSKVVNLPDPIFHATGKAAVAPESTMRMVLREI